MRSEILIFYKMEGLPDETATQTFPYFMWQHKSLPAQKQTPYCTLIYERALMFFCVTRSHGITRASEVVSSMMYGAGIVAAETARLQHSPMHLLFTGGRYIFMVTDEFLHKITPS